MLNNEEIEFLALAKNYEKISDELDALRLKLEEVMLKLDYNTYVQDPTTTAVYKIVEPTGTFVSFKKVDYKRTNLPNEKGGGGTVLSKKEAQEAGFTV